jgi:hypothetical protein
VRDCIQRLTQSSGVHHSSEHKSEM